MRELLSDATDNFLLSVGVNFALDNKWWKLGFASAGMAGAPLHLQRVEQPQEEVLCTSVSQTVPVR